MKHFFVKNLFFVILVNVLIKPFWVFFIDRTVQNKVGYTQFGTYWALLNTTLVFQIILDMGILNYTNKTIAQSNDQVGKLFSSTLFAKLILFALYASIILGLSFSLQHTAQERYLLMGIIGIQFLNSFLQYIRSIISALHFFKLDGIVSILDKLLMIGICGILFLNSKTSTSFNIHWFVIAQLGSYLISVIIALWILKLLYKKPFWSRINRARIVQIIKDSLPYAALIFLMSIYMRSDALLLERLHPNGNFENGIYASAYRLLDVGNMIALLFAGVLLPMFSKQLAAKQKINELVKVAVHLLLPFTIIIASIAIVWSEEIMAFLYHPLSTYDAQVYAWLMASFPAFGIIYIYSTLLTANGNMKQLIGMASLGVCINLSLNFFFIPSKGALACAQIACLTEWIVALYAFFYAVKLLQLPKNYSLCIRLIFFTLLFITISAFAKSMFTQWIFAALGTACMGIALGFVFQFFSVKEWKNTLLPKTN